METFSSSILDAQRAIYGNDNDVQQPPMIPHGDDPRAYPPRNAKRQKMLPPPQRQALTTMTSDVAANPTSTNSSSSSSNATEEKALPASELPGGFPPELAFRALAAYATIRTLSCPLRLSPFTPNVFLRALYLPYPNRLLGRIHTHVLRILLSHLPMGYHWKEGSAPPPLDVSKKRKLDGIRWPLRGGDNLRYLDTYTWPIFYDDYCHLTADILHSCMHDVSNYVDDKFLEDSATALVDRFADRWRSNPRAPPQSQLTTLYLGDDDNDDSEDEEFRAEEIPEEDDDDDDDYDINRPKKKRKYSKLPTTTTSSSSHHRSGAVSASQSTSHYSRPQNSGSSLSTYARSSSNFPSSISSSGYGPRMVPFNYPPTNYPLQQHSYHQRPSVNHQIPKLLSMKHMYAPTTTTTSYSTFPQSSPYHRPNFPYQQPPPPAVVFPYQHVLPNFYRGTTNARPDSRVFEVSDLRSRTTDTVSVMSSPIQRRPKPSETSRSLLSQQSGPGVSFSTSNSQKASVMIRNSRSEETPQSETSRQSSLSGQSGPELSVSSNSLKASVIIGNSSSEEAPQSETSRQSLLPQQSRPELSVSTNSQKASVVISNSSSEEVQQSEISRQTSLSQQSGPDLSVSSNSQKPSVVISNSNSEEVPQSETSKQSSLSQSVPDSSVTSNSQKASVAISHYSAKEVPVLETTGSEPKKILPDSESTLEPFDILHAFMRGKTFQKANAVESDANNKNVNDTHDEPIPTPPSTRDIGHWPHFGPLKRMRAGMHYHQLSVEEKLVILEFLIDELLSIDTIASIFTQRHNATAHFRCPYGPKPTEAELQRLFEADGELNANECGVCGEEGDLLCCDSCLGSYHKHCVMHVDTDDDNAKWYCPECTLGDPAAFGPMDAGRKSAIDWFTHDDVVEAHRRVDSEQTGADIAASCWPLATVKEPSTDYLVVHGFVFRRSHHHRLREPHNDSLPLTAAILQDVLSTWGSDFCKKWPISQIPIQETALFQKQLVCSAVNYFRTPDSFDPSLYDNLYRKAPLTETMRRIKDAHMMDFEVRCATASTKNLSMILSRDTSNDATVTLSLRSNYALYNGIEMITLFLLRIETDLTKACLLNALWNSNLASGKRAAWSEQVVKCKSIRRLSKLLVRLVDSIHPQAFLEGWFHCPRLRSKEPEHLVRHEGKVSLSDAYTPEDESTRRHWERCGMSNVPTLVAKSSKRLSDWICEIRPNVSSTVRLGKRKPLRRNSPNHVDTSAFDQQSHVDKNIFETKGKSFDASSTCSDGGCEKSDGENDLDKNQDRKKDTDGSFTVLRKRRHSDRVTTSLEQNDSSVDSNVAFADKRIDSQMRKRVSDFEGDLKTIVPPEVHWPMAGQKLFPPVGYLPKSSLKWLGRNAGGSLAPFVTYSQLHEVGQVAYAHVWRKRAARCTSFEELLLILRVLESFLDHEMIKKFTASAHRSKSSKSKHSVGILWTQRDLATGIDFHLVGRPTGAAHWVSSLEVEVVPLVIEQARRKQKHFEMLRARISQKPVSSSESSKAAVKPSMDLVNPESQSLLVDHLRQVEDLIGKHGLLHIPEGLLESLRLSALGKLQRAYNLKGIDRTRAQMLQEILNVEANGLSRKKTNDSKTENVSSIQSASSVISSSAPPPPTELQHCGNQNGSSTTHADVKPGRNLLSIASCVVQDHVAASKQLTRTFGVQPIPSSEIESLRARSKQRLVRELQTEGLEFNSHYFDEMLRQAEEGVYNQSIVPTPTHHESSQTPVSLQNSQATNHRYRMPTEVDQMKIEPNSLNEQGPPMSSQLRHETNSNSAAILSVRAGPQVMGRESNSDNASNFQNGTMHGLSTVGAAANSNFPNSNSDNRNVQNGVYNAQITQPFDVQYPVAEHRGTQRVNAPAFMNNTQNSNFPGPIPPYSTGGALPQSAMHSVNGNSLPNGAYGSSHNDIGVVDVPHHDAQHGPNNGNFQMEQSSPYSNGVNQFAVARGMDSSPGINSSQPNGLSTGAMPSWNHNSRGQGFTQGNSFMSAPSQYNQPHGTVGMNGTMPSSQAPSMNYTQGSQSSPSAGTTPLSFIRQIIAQHKKTTMMILNECGTTFPPSLLQPSRQKSLSQLAKIMEISGIAPSMDQLSRVLVEAETEAFHEATAIQQMRQTMQMSTALPPSSLGPQLAQFKPHNAASLLANNGVSRGPAYDQMDGRHQHFTQPPTLQHSSSSRSGQNLLQQNGGSSLAHQLYSPTMEVARFSQDAYRQNQASQPGYGQRADITGDASGPYLNSQRASYSMNERNSMHNELNHHYPSALTASEWNRSTTTATTNAPVNHENAGGISTSGMTTTDVPAAAEQWSHVHSLSSSPGPMNEALTSDDNEWLDESLFDSSGKVPYQEV